MAKTIANVLVGVAKLEFKYPVGGTYVEVGYTEDGVTMEYNAETSEIEVEEETVAIGRVITKESIKFTCNMAEASLTNLNQAMAGGVLAGAVVTLGAGAIKTVSVKLTGTNPALGARTIEIPLATAMGTVSNVYKKGTKTVVPVTFQAIKGAAAVCTITDS